MNAIAAVDRNWSIGRDGKLLVSIPADMEYFKSMTMGKTVIMGRKTLESFPGGRPLRGRNNIVLSGNPDLTVPGATVVHSPEEAAEAVSGLPEEDVCVIGGQAVYEAMLPWTNTAYITRIDYIYDADTRFPDLDADEEWELAREGEEQTYFDIIYEFDVYRRKAAVR